MQMTCPILPRRQFVKTAALLICGVTSVALPGCSLGVMFGKMLTGDPKRLSEFKSMTREDLAKGKRKVLVICTTPESVESELATLKFDLIDGITKESQPFSIEGYKHLFLCSYSARLHSVRRAGFYALLRVVLLRIESIILIKIPSIIKLRINHNLPGFVYESPLSCFIITNSNCS